MIVMLITAVLTATQPVTNLEQITLDQCFNGAVRKSYTLKDQAELLKQAEIHYAQALQNFTPTLVFTGQGLTGTTNTASLKAILSQPLFRGFRSMTYLEQTSELIKAQKAAREWALNQLYQDTALAYYNLLLIRRDVEHVDAQLRLYDRRLSEVEGWVKIGRSRMSDLSSIKAARSQVLAQKTQLNGQYNAAVELLAFQTGVTNPDLVVAAPQKEMLIEPLSNYIESTRNRADIKAAKARLNATKKTTIIVQADKWPWADFSTSASIGDISRPASMNWNAQLTITYSLFADTIFSTKLEEAKSQERQVENSLKNLEETVEKDVITSYINYNSYVQQTQALQESLKYLKENVDALEKDYRLGVARITDFITASSSYEETARTLDHLKYQALMEWVRLNVNSGKLKVSEEVKP